MSKNSVHGRLTALRGWLEQMNREGKKKNKKRRK
jgi:hypothetical protein